MSRRRPLVLLETANLIAGASNSLVMIVIPWLILERTGSAAAAGAAGALTGIPGIVVAPIVGTLVDRLGRKTVSIGSDVLSAFSVALFPLAEFFGFLDLAVILALTLLGAVFDPAGYTARKSLIPDVATAARTDVGHLNGLHEGLFSAGWVIGPVVGAAAIAAVGAVNAMWVAFAAFVLAAAAVAAIRVPNRAAPHEEGPDLDARHERFWASIGTGIRVLVRDKPLWALTLAVAILSLLYMPTESVMLPVHFEQIDEPGAFGLIISMLAAGGMVGAFGYGWLARRIRRSLLARLCMSIACVAFVPLSLLLPLPAMLVAALALGLAWGPMNPLLNSLVQDRFPAQQHGRVYGVQLALFYAAPPLGQMVAGIAVQRFGVASVFPVLAAALVLTALVIDLMPGLRGLDDPVTGPDAAPSPSG